MTDFTILIRNLDGIRRELGRTIHNHGIAECREDMTLSEINGCAKKMGVGIQHIRGGCSLFEGNTDIRDIAFMDFTHIKNMNRMCYGCTGLQTVDLKHCQPASILWAFYGCSALTEVTNIDTSKVTSVSELFHGCRSLVSVTPYLDLSNVTSEIDSTFVSCSSLRDIEFRGTIKVDIAMNGCRNLSVRSLESLIYALDRVVQPSSTFQKECKIGSVNLNKLSQSMKDLAAGKGWTLL